ncbi:MAG: TrkH family potassium uptake protein [Candidatus Krumholzibacteriia bacterium]
MRIANVLHILGFLLMFLAAAMLLPIGFSLYYGDRDYVALLFSAGITLLAGLAAFATTRTDGGLRTKEGFAVVTFSWIFFSLFGSLPFIISGAIPSFTNAFFETMSGFTTTGATTLGNIEQVSHGILFWRSLTHWIGGMGIIVLSLAILPFLGVGGMQLFKAEVPGPVADKLTPRITETAKILWGVYVLLSAAEVVFLMFGGMNFFDALCHTFGTMATGGYSTRNASVGAYGSAYIDYVIIVFMILAGTNFSLHYRFLRRDFRAYARSQEFMFYLSVIGLAALVVGAGVFNHYGGVAGSVRGSLFQVVSILTTTGFATADYEQWSFGSQFVLYILMFVGGCAGSTGGGIKIVRIYLLGRFALSEITRLIHPNAVVPVRIGDNVVPRQVMTNILGFFVLFMVVFVVGVLAMAAMGLDMPTAFGAVTATLANVGPGLGDVGPTDNYAQIPAAGKWVLSFLMLMGRLELFTVIILLSRSYWQK